MASGVFAGTVHFLPGDILAQSAGVPRRGVARTLRFRNVRDRSRGVARPRQSGSGM